MNEINNLLIMISEQKKEIVKLQTEKFIQKILEFDYGNLKQEEFDDLIISKIGNYSMYKMGGIFDVDFKILSKEKKKQYKELLEIHLKFLRDHKELL